MRLLSLAIAATFCLASFAPAQTPAPDALVSWSFDDGTADWQSADPAASLATTDDANVTRGQGHGTVLEYSYTTIAGRLAGLFAGTATDLSGAKSLRFWLRTSEPTIILAGATEADESAYHAAFTSLPGRWQEIALDLGEFRLGDDSTDENGRLDPDQIRGLGLVDATGFLAQMIEQVPFLMPPDLGPRVLWLDDMSVSTEPVPPRWSETQLNGKRAVRLDSFETTPLQWLTLAGKNVEVDYDRDYKAEGDLSLRVQYDLPPDKIMGIMTSPQGPDLSGMKRLRLWLMSEAATTVLVGLKERDESNYVQMIELQPGDKLALFDLNLADSALGDDSTDENGQLDLNQVTEFAIADVSVMTGKPVGVNTLWIDDIAFTE